MVLAGWVDGDDDAATSSPRSAWHSVATEVEEKEEDEMTGRGGGQRSKQSFTLRFSICPTTTPPSAHPLLPMVIKRSMTVIYVGAFGIYIPLLCSINYRCAISILAHIEPFTVRSSSFHLSRSICICRWPCVALPNWGPISLLSLLRSACLLGH